MADVDHPYERTESTDQALDAFALNPDAMARRAVAHAVRHIRRWDEPGILGVWARASKQGYDFVSVAVCFLETAADESAQTPGAVLPRLANGWRRDQKPPTPLPHLERCQQCHLRHAPNTPCGDIGEVELPLEYVEAKRKLGGPA